MSIAMGVNKMDTKSLAKKEVLRFSAVERFTHGVHAAAFILLLFTGLGVLLTGFQPAMKIVGGIDIARDIHRVVGALAVVLVIVGFVLDRKNLPGWITNSLKFRKDDLEYAKNFPIEFFGGHAPFPPQGKFNGGEKMNILLMFTMCVFIALSGFIMWFPAAFPAGLVRWSYPVHSGLVLLLTAVLLAHLYLGLLHPDSNRALKGIFTGWVPADFAREHYEEWFDKLAEEEPERIKTVK